MTTTVEAGRKGGLKVLRNRGRAFYSRIGRIGQAVMRQRYPGMATVWGKKGGRPRKISLDGRMGEKDK